MQLTSHAKVNLYLKIGKKLKNNYHNIQSVMQLVQLHDEMNIESIPDDQIIVESNNKDLEQKNNLAYKAAMLLKKDYKVKKGVKIYLKKSIPISAGLGGGSSNAANTLVTLSKMWDLNVPLKKLLAYGAQIGADVPFFIASQASIVEGIGDKIKPLRKSISMNIILVNPGIKVSTSWAYKQFDNLKSKVKFKANIKDLINAMNKKDFKKIAQNMHNDFEQIIENKHKITLDIKTHLKKFGALRSMVSGSGPTVIGLYDSIYPAREAYFKLKDIYPFVYLTKTF